MIFVTAERGGVFNVAVETGTRAIERGENCWALNEKLKTASRSSTRLFLKVYP